MQSAFEPVQFAALREPVYDDVTGRTYQLVTRLSDDVPHTLSCAGNHADALVDTLNTRRALAHERNTLRKSMSSTARPKLSEAERAAPTYA